MVSVRAVAATVVVTIVVVATGTMSSNVSTWMSAWMVSYSSSVYRAVDWTVVVSVDAVVSTSVNPVSVRTCPIVIIAVCIASVDRIVPSSSSPCQRAVEVAEPNIKIILIVREDKAKICVPAAPPSSVEVAMVVDA